MSKVKNRDHRSSSGTNAKSQKKDITKVNE